MPQIRLPRIKDNIFEMPQEIKLSEMVKGKHKRRNESTKVTDSVPYETAKTFKEKLRYRSSRPEVFCRKGLQLY